MALITLALIDNDKAFCKETIKSFQSCYGDTIQVVGTAHDGEEGIKLLTEARPDVALIEVYMPVADGVAVVESVKSKEETKEISCVMLSSGSMDYGMRIASDAGADYICVKPMDIHRLAKCIINLNNYKKKINLLRKYGDFSKDLSGALGNGLHNTPVAYSVKPEKFSSAFLTEMGFRTNTKGFCFLKSAISACIKEPEQMEMLTKMLYPSIAELHSSTGSNVERVMRHSISQAWKKEENFRTWLSDRPTVGTFLRSAVSDYVNKYGVGLN